MKINLNDDGTKFLEIAEDPTRNRIIIESNVEPTIGNGISCFGEPTHNQVFFYSLKLLTNFGTSKAWEAYPDTNIRCSAFLGYYGYITTHIEGKSYAS